ncbi:class F sortase [Actinoplanes sp. GCM10030250]|uniref:class F sortase n=1 Tax=Actinoplanes sp. GCM10030250 TaxID=3273376 RepID=UPI00361C9648
MRWAYVCSLLLMVIFGLAGAERVSGTQPDRPAAAGGPIVADRFRSDADYAAVAVPVRLRIPELRVESRLDRLGVQADGAVAVPADPDVAGWFSGGPRPGQPGPAVILGHVDSKSGPGVFAGLAGARVGTLVHVERGDGSTVTFRIGRISRVPKDEFPTELVYAPTLDATLRLVTCGGGFDRSRGSYRDNVIAYADPV